MSKYFQKLAVITLCFIPVTAWSYIDKYDPYWDEKGSGKDFVWFVIIGGIVLLINWIINLFKGKK